MLTDCVPHTTKVKNKGTIHAKYTQDRCPECGALECLCRPRFFAGQLLTEQDLNRLDQYLKKKSRLQNRNLHGWGVVNGLRVLCDPCGQIKVTKGYALSPCGDDIVVCEDTAVDICELIRKCKHKERTECKPFQRPPNRDCEDLEEEWCIAIRYCEWPTRGITALRNVGCSCGKSAPACTCGGGAGPGACGCPSNTTQAKKRGAPPECEPTVICEGYAFDVYRKPAEKPRDPSDSTRPPGFQFEGPLYENFKCCLQGLTAAVPPLPTNQGTQITNDDLVANKPAWQIWCCRFRENLIDYFRNRDATNCTILDTLNCLSCPSPNLPNDLFAARMQESIAGLALILVEALVDCLCLSLLPPAPEPTHDARVPLASVRIRCRDCEVISVCNWSTCREILTTWPAVCYWTSLIPIGKWLHEALDKICCRTYSKSLCPEEDQPKPPPTTPPPTSPPTPDPIGDTSSEAEEAAARARAESAQRSGFNAGNAARLRLNPTFDSQPEVQAFLNLAGLSAQRVDQPLEPLGLLKSVFRLNLDDKAPALTEIESNNLPQFLALNLLARPFVADSLGEQAPLQTSQKASPDLDARLASLEEKVRSQEEELRRLRSDKNKRKRGG